MAQLGDLIVSGKSRFLNTINTSEIDLTTDSTHYGSITPTKIKYQDGTYNQTELTGNKLEVKTNQNSTSVTPSTLEISSSTKKLTIVANDITKTNETWDGTNASLTTAVTNAKDTVKQNVLSTASTNSYKLLLSGSADASAHTEGVYKYSTLEFTPDNNESVFDGNALSMYNNSWETVIRLSCGTSPYVYVKDSSPKYLKVYNTDIVLGDWNGTSNTWDGTKTSLKEVLSDLKAKVITETVTLTFASGVATLSKKANYILINIYPYNRSDNIYGITSFTEQTDGSYKIRNNSTSLSTNLSARAIWLRV